MSETIDEKNENSKVIMIMQGSSLPRTWSPNLKILKNYQKYSWLSANRFCKQSLTDEADDKKET